MHTCIKTWHHPVICTIFMFLWFKNKSKMKRRKIIFPARTIVEVIWVANCSHMQPEWDTRNETGLWFFLDQSSLLPGHLSSRTFGTCLRETASLEVCLLPCLPLSYHSALPLQRLIQYLLSVYCGQSITFCSWLISFSE
jgi:hypothetical protein